MHSLYGLALAANPTGIVEQTGFLATMELWFNALALSDPMSRRSKRNGDLSRDGRLRIV
jgi:hypothetical protein